MPKDTIESRLARLEQAVARLIDNHVSRLDAESDEYGGGPTAYMRKLTQELQSIVKDLDHQEYVVRCPRCELDQRETACWHHKT